MIRTNAWRTPTQLPQQLQNNEVQTESDTKGKSPTSAVHAALEKIREQILGVKQEVDKEMEEAQSELEAFTLTIAELGGLLKNPKNKYYSKRKRLVRSGKSRNTNEDFK